MTKLKAYEELADPLIIPINGKEYTIPPLGAHDGILFTLASDPANANELDTLTDDQVNRMFLGDVYDEMIADNVPGEALTRALLAAMADHKSGRLAATMLWETGGDPKAVTDYVKTLVQRAKRKKPTDKATSTKRQASTSGTTSRKASRAPKV